MVTQPFVFQHEAHMRELVNYLLIDVAQVYRLYALGALNAAMGMKRIYRFFILADNSGCGVICHCGMSRAEYANVHSWVRTNAIALLLLLLFRCHY